MARRRILALVMAGGAGGRLQPLTATRAKPAMPYGGVYRLIDIPLSNCLHSGVGDVWLLQQYEPHALTDHLSNGRPWDLDATYGGLLLLHPHTGSAGAGWHGGNADAIYRKRELVREFEPEAVVVLSADHAYRLDYLEVVDAHLESEAGVTVVTTEVAREEAGRFGVVEAESGGRVTGFEYKPERPRTGTVTTEVFVYTPAALLETLERLAEAADGDDEEVSLGDFGEGLLPRLVDAGQARAHPLGGYWRDLGTLESYWQGHMELLGDQPALDLDDPGWPLLTRAPQRAPARIAAGATLEESLVSPGCTVAGTVSRSVLGPGVVVEAGALVGDAVLLGDSRVRAGARVEGAVVDVGADIGEEAAVGVALEGDPARLTVVGRGRRVARGRAVAGRPQ